MIEPHEVGLDRFHQLFDGRSNTSLRQDQVGDSNLVVRVDVSGKRSERSVGHTNTNRGCMLERIRHGEQQYFQWRALSEEYQRSMGGRVQTAHTAKKRSAASATPIEFVHESALPQFIDKAKLDEVSTLALAALASVSAWTSKVP